MIIQHKAKQPRLDALAERDRAIKAGFEWEGETFQIDPGSQVLISGRVGKINTLGVENVPDFMWRTWDNTSHSFTASEFLEFAVAVDEYVESLYMKSWAV